MKPNQQQPSTDDSLAKADEIQRRSKQVRGANNTDSKVDFAPIIEAARKNKNKVSDVIQNITLMANTISGIKIALDWTNKNVIQPVRELPYVGPVFSFIPKIIYDSYYRFTHPYPNENAWEAAKHSISNLFFRRANRVVNAFRKEPVPFAPDQRHRGPLSKHRAGVAALMSAWALTGALSVPVAGDSFRYLVAEPAFDMTRIALTVGFNGVSGHGFGLTHDTLYFGVPSKETGDDVYHVTGSDHRNSNESNSVSFEVRNRLVNEVWSWTHGHGPYRPDYVVGPIRPDSNKCDAVSYGSRFRVARWASFRPELLNVSCQASGGFAAPQATPPG